MTDRERARIILMTIKHMRDDESVDFVTAHLTEVRRDGLQSGIDILIDHAHGMKDT